jgi:hypothetical protein
LLLLASGAAPPEHRGFGDLEGESGEIVAICVLVDARESENGWIVELIDEQSIGIRGFCSQEVMSTPPPIGTTLEIRARATLDPAPFLFIDEIQLYAVNEGKI